VLAPKKLNIGPKFRKPKRKLKKINKMATIAEASKDEETMQEDQPMNFFGMASSLINKDNIFYEKVEGDTEPN